MKKSEAIEMLKCLDNSKGWVPLENVIKIVNMIETDIPKRCRCPIICEPYVFPELSKKDKKYVREKMKEFEDDQELNRAVEEFKTKLDYIHFNKEEEK